MERVPRVSVELHASSVKFFIPKTILSFADARYRSFLTAIFALSICVACSSRTSAPTEARYLPAGDLLDIVKDFQRLAKEDTYRFPIPKDVTGVNIMKATLVRLDDTAQNPGQFTDTFFNKAWHRRLRIRQGGLTVRSP